MKWNWEQEEWPEFRYQVDAVERQEAEFLSSAGFMLGAYQHVGDDEQSALRVEMLSDEAVGTSEIEGEYLDRDSVQSSIRRHLGLQCDLSRSRPAEHGIAEMMVNVYETWSHPLSNAAMCRWHEMLSAGRRDLEDVGRYRRHADPMRVVSGSIHDPKVHFVAPPSARVPVEMKGFVAWYNAAKDSGPPKMAALARAGIAHLYFVSVHPFEDGNGRIGRALTEKVLAQSLGRPALISLSRVINNKRRDYYDALERNNRSLDVTDWVVYFANTILAAQAETLRWVEFVIAKGKFLLRFQAKVNERQLKVLVRMFREGPDGFRGGLSATNYIRITGTSTATATRDLQDLVARGALTRSGERKHARYTLNL